MALRVNGTTLPDTGSCKFNGSTVKKIIYNGTTVWQKLTTVQTVNITATISFGATQQSGTRTVSVKMETPSSGTIISTKLTGKFVLTVAGTSKTVELTISNNWTASTIFTCGNSDNIQWQTLSFYNKDGTLLQENSVSLSSSSATMSKVYTVDIMEPA